MMEKTRKWISTAWTAVLACAALAAAIAAIVVTVVTDTVSAIIIGASAFVITAAVVLPATSLRNRP